MQLARFHLGALVGGTDEHDDFRRTPSRGAGRTTSWRAWPGQTERRVEYVAGFVSEAVAATVQARRQEIDGA